MLRARDKEMSTKRAEEKKAAEKKLEKLEQGWSSGEDGKNYKPQSEKKKKRPKETHLGCSWLI